MQNANADVRMPHDECCRRCHLVILHQTVFAFCILHFALRSLYHVSGGNFEDGRKAGCLARGARRVFHPRPAGPPLAAEGRASAPAHLFFRNVLGQLHDDAFLDQADKEFAAGVAGRQAEHATKAKAAMLLDEFSEEWL
jgi:hypothetical protein